jgi:hypothetical protein
VTDRVTLVPHADGLICTRPVTSGASHSTVVSGTVLTILISPNSPRWLASEAGSLSSAQSSGGDLTRVRCTSEETLIAPQFRVRLQDSCLLEEIPLAA